MVIAVSGWMNQRQLQVIDYLREENRVLREQLGGRRLRINDNQRRRLAAVALQLNRFFRTFGAIQFDPKVSHGRTRALSSSKPARPYICRLITFSRLIWPSSGPLLHGVSIASSRVVGINGTENRVKVTRILQIP